MALRFWRRVRLAPGVTLNLSKRGGSVSLGPRGAKYSVGTSGRRGTVGLPGTGLFYTVRGGGGRGGGGARSSAQPKVPAASRLNLGFFQRLVTPVPERALVDGLKALVESREDEALVELERGVDLVDAHWLAGVLRLKGKHLDEARKHFDYCLERSRELGRMLEKYGIVPTTSLAITPEVTAHVEPCRRGCLLALVEIDQAEGARQAALAHLDDLLAEDPDDVVVQLSLAEILLEEEDRLPSAAERIVRMSGSVTNETTVHAALLLYRGRALAALGLHDAAFRTLTVALRRKKDRDPELLKTIRYQRALAYQAAGRGSRARSDLEALFAEDPDFSDVRERLFGD